MKVEVPYPLVDETEAELMAHVEVELDAEGNAVTGVYVEDMNGDPVTMTVPEFLQFAEQQDPGLTSLFDMAQDAMRDQEESARQAAEIRDPDEFGRQVSCRNCNRMKPVDGPCPHCGHQDE